mmetsp:Transcript_2582/g.5236  ORF Transcript_2582/g.5236 Transcript_2582/m.5236 type:complete len:255 (-) Transcript_2582:196-960(-)
MPMVVHTTFHSNTCKHNILHQTLKALRENLGRLLCNGQEHHDVVERRPCLLVCIGDESPKGLCHQLSDPAVLAPAVQDGSAVAHRGDDARPRYDQTGEFLLAEPHRILLCEHRGGGVSHSPRHRDTHPLVVDGRQIVDLLPIGGEVGYLHLGDDSSRIEPPAHVLSGQRLRDHRRAAGVGLIHDLVGVGAQPEHVAKLLEVVDHDSHCGTAFEGTLYLHVSCGGGVHGHLITQHVMDVGPAVGVRSRTDLLEDH